jgi:hypothetical protein
MGATCRSSEPFCARGGPASNERQASCADPVEATYKLLPWLRPPDGAVEDVEQPAVRALLGTGGREPGGLVLGMGEFLYMPSAQELAAAAGPTCVDRHPPAPLPASSLGRQRSPKVENRGRESDRTTGWSAKGDVRLASGVPTKASVPKGDRDA